jgi:predicted HAD superfamily Cof-like phosphohydrolase
MTRLQKIISSMVASVREFRTASDLPISEYENPPKIIEELIQEHIWIKEEWIELWNATNDRDDIEIADAYCDLIYFAVGALLRFGLHTEIKEFATGRRRVELYSHITLLNHVNILDTGEFTKIVYVAIYAFENKFPQVSILDCFNEVHRSNMSKFCRSIQQAEETRQKYSRDKIETEIFKKGRYWIVKKKVDGKTLKSVDFVAPNLLKYLA